jgi:hypothetical protein
MAARGEEVTADTGSRHVNTSFVATVGEHLPCPGCTRLFDITSEQYFTAQDLASAIHRDKVLHGFFDRCADRNPEMMQFIGILGEMVYADYAMLPRPKLLRGRVDDGFDFEEYDNKVDVKSTTCRSPHPHLILNHEDMAKDAERYVLLYLDLDEKKALILADMSRSEFMARCEEKDMRHGKRWTIRVTNPLFAGLPPTTPERVCDDHLTTGAYRNERRETCEAVVREGNPRPHIAEGHVGSSPTPSTQVER